MGCVKRIFVVAGLFAMLAAMGCGGSGGGEPSSMGDAPPEVEPPPSPSPAPPVDPPEPTTDGSCDGGFPSGEVYVTVVQILGAQPLNGERSTKNVLLRIHGGETELLDFHGDAVPSRRGRLYFSSPAVAWGWERSGLETWLVKSEDAGITWERAFEIPQQPERRAEFVVDEDAGRIWGLFEYESRASFGTPGPFVGLGNLATGEWFPVDVPPSEWLEPWWTEIAARDGRVEVARWWPSLEIYDVTAFLRVEPVEVDEGFAPSRYVAAGPRSWFAGALNATETVATQPRLLLSRGDGSWDLVAPGVEFGTISAIDFVNEWEGFVCGVESTTFEPFCTHSEDGGDTWSRGTLPPDATGAIRGVARSHCGRGGVALQSLYASNLAYGTFHAPPHAVLTTVDHGASWATTSIPRLGDQARLGRLSSNARFGDDTADLVVVEAPELDLGFVPPPLAGDAPGPVVYATGDDLGRGPTIMGTALRSEDGGATWVEIFAQPGGSLTGVSFVDRETGWIAGGGRLHRTDDAGVTFEDQTPNVLLHTIHDIRLVDAGDSDYAIAVAHGVREEGDPRMDHPLHTTDGGATWQLGDMSDDPQPGHPRELRRGCVTEEGFGLLLRSTVMHATSDGGVTWNLIPGTRFVGHQNYFYDPVVVCTGASDLWIVTQSRDEDDVLWHSWNGGRNWTNRSAEVGVARNDNFHATGAFVGSGTGWLAITRRDPVETRFLRKRTVGGAWMQLSSPLFDGEYVEAIGFADAVRGVLLTTDRRSLWTVDAGSSWESTDLPEGFAPIGLSVVP